MIASVPELIRATIRYVECKSLIAGTTTPQGLTLRAAPIKHLYQGIVRNAELPDAAGLPPARPKIGDVTPDGLAAFRRSLAGKGARILHLAEGAPTSPARQHFLDLVPRPTSPRHLPFRPPPDHPLPAPAPPARR